MLVLCFLLNQKQTERKKMDKNLEEAVASVASMVVTAQPVYRRNSSNEAQSWRLRTSD
jgi:hypothetical protein